VAYNVTSGFNLTFGHVEVPLLPSQAAAVGAETASPRAFPPPLVLRPIHLDIGPVSVVVLSNDDNISGWNTALVLSSSQDAQKAFSVWKSFNGKLGDEAWKHAALVSVGQAGCDTLVTGVSPAYVAPQSLDALAGFWFVQLWDSVFSVSPSLAAAYQCFAFNFSLVDGHQKFMSGLPPLFAVPSAHGNAFFMHAMQPLPPLLIPTAQRTRCTKTAASASAATTPLYRNTPTCRSTAFPPPLITPTYLSFQSLGPQLQVPAHQASVLAVQSCSERFGTRVRR
jgi:hypothetical protein